MRRDVGYFHFKDEVAGSNPACAMFTRR
ncbi:hypothetical protein L3Y21_gp094 [Gordonia phage Rabbitrun]|uniref:Uncharacterized protein n=1 Tax=Gordonia phage Rabbitrun TaxID=2762280 RepID=A0A7G8LIV0_9CAUD|nr:hypothetical protein L3Y21_gp094 [Gordonia phage Rabbitrun]QNJ57172.1 hypothetical protein SEA_RABBITRUN_94 [Gordonia phage Rabbitrun]